MARPGGRGGAPIGRLLARPILQGWGGRTPNVALPEIDSALRPDMERMKRELDVLEAARSDGRLNTPARNQRDPNQSQMRIVNRVVDGMARLNRSVAETLGGAVADANRRVPRTLDETVAAAAMDARVGSVLHDRQSGLVELREGELETRRNLSYFRRRHGLNRSASYRESPLLFWAILIGVLVLESFVNAFLLRRIAEQGWVGGAVLAAIISAVNIILGIVAGLVGWRLLGHRFPPQRILGLFATIFAHGAALLWNLYAAHFREVAEAAANAGAGVDITAYALDTLGHIRNNGWFGLNSLFSWGLFAAGIAIHLIMAREAWDDMADRYWDYRRYDLGYRRARGAYEEAVADAKAAALEEARAVLLDLENEHERQAESQQDLKALVDLAERRLNEGRDAEAEWARQGVALLRVYREENRLVRTDPSPTYFDLQSSPEDFRAAHPGEEDEREAEQSRSTALQALDTLHRAAVEAQRVQDYNADVLSRLNARLSEQIASLLTRIDALKETIDHEAQRNLAGQGGAAPPERDPEPAQAPEPRTPDAAQA